MTDKEKDYGEVCHDRTQNSPKIEQIVRNHSPIPYPVLSPQNQHLMSINCACRAALCARVFLQQHLFAATRLSVGAFYEGVPRHR